MPNRFSHAIAIAMKSHPRTIGKLLIALVETTSLYDNGLQEWLYWENFNKNNQN
jgi:hypothetical protein